MGIHDLLERRCNQRNLALLGGLNIGLSIQDVDARLHQEIGRNDAELVQRFFGLLQVEAPVRHVVLGLGDLGRRMGIPGLFQRVFRVAHVDSCLSDGLLQIRHGLGVQHGDRVAGGYPVALRDGKIRNEPLLSEGDGLTGRVRQGSGHAHIVHEVASGHRDQLRLRRLFLGARIAPRGKGVVSARASRDHDDHDCPQLPRLHAFQDVSEYGHACSSVPA